MTSMTRSSIAAFPARRALAACLGLAGFAIGSLPSVASAQSLLPRLQAVVPTVVGDAFFQRASRAKGVSPSSFFFPDTGVGKESIAVFTLTNSDAYGGLLTVNGPPSVTGAGFVAMALSGACAGGVLAAGASCQVAAKFQPTDSNYYYGQLNFNTTPFTSSVLLQGYGVPVITATIDPYGLDFGTQRTGTESLTQRITIANNATGGSIEISSITVTPPFDAIFCTPTTVVAEEGESTAKRLGAPCSTGFYGGSVADPGGGAKIAKGAGLYDRGQCRQSGLTLYSGDFCSLDVVFSPTVPGRFTGMLTVKGSFGQESFIPLLGLSGASLAVSVAPEAVAFGDVVLRQTSAPSKVAIANSGFEPVTVNSITVVPPRGTPVAAATLKAVAAAADYIVNHNCGSLAPAASCAAELQFKPTELGARAAELKIEGNFEGSPKYVSLSGTGAAIPFPVLSYSLSSIAFGRTSAGSGASETFEIANSGQLPVRFSQIYVRGDFFVTHDCPASLQSGQSCKVTVVYRASLPGSSIGEIVIESDAQQSGGTIPISGSSCRPASLRARAGLSGC